MRNLLIFLLFSVLLTSCEFFNYGYKYNRGDLPDSPVNLEDFNTEYDDYNSTAPTLGWLIPFCFSTNRNSQGGEFDVIYQPMNVNFSKETGELKVTNEYSNWGIYMEDYSVIQQGLNKIKTSGDEFGPYLIVDQDAFSGEFSFTLLYATDISGNFQINYTSNLSETGFSEPLPVEFLNSEFDDLYPTFNQERSKLYFCSNREGETFDIFFTELPGQEGDLEQLLSDSAAHEIYKDTILSGSAEDKCPFAFENVLVFASDRVGGFGGYDLYYSKFENNAWSEPVNFGAGINSESDEYRPILIDEGVTAEETMMVFSSDRDGGEGGFDLYFVGVRIE
ncbi:MAG: hypothetical protein ABFS38_05840 [Bacteroidota bacterium]